MEMKESEKSLLSSIVYKDLVVCRKTKFKHYCWNSFALHILKCGIVSTSGTNQTKNVIRALVNYFNIANFQLFPPLFYSRV